jgi:calcineurin-like phosphoesterase family protein
MTTFLTSDEHYSHSNIIKHSARPFRDLEEMNAELTRRFNETVGPDDITWHLGDFAWKPSEVGPLLAKLNGKHHLICGNHDSCHPVHKRHVRETRRYLDAGFLSVSESFTEDFAGIGRVLLCHLPLRRADATDERYADRRPDSLHGADWLFHGHVHEKWRLRGRMLNVGVDVWEFRPVSVEQIAEYLASESA